MMKHVAITEAKTQLNELVAEIESTGDDVVLTRDGVPVARLIRENKQSLSEELMPEQNRAAPESCCAPPANCGRVECRCDA